MDEQRIIWVPYTFYISSSFQWSILDFTGLIVYKLSHRQWIYHHILLKSTKQNLDISDEI